MTSTSTGQARAEEALSSQNPKAPLWAKLVGTFFYAGYGKPGPGTWGSVATVLLWRGIGGMLQPAWQVPAALVSAAAVTVIGIPAATRVAHEAGREDPSHVVVDEVAGQLIALIGAPLGWKSLVAGLILFRAFDIMKPPPLRRLERLPEGVGIMMDDIGAGLYALVVMQVLLHFGFLR